MPRNEKGQAEARPIPNCVVYRDATESKVSPLNLQVSVMVRRTGVDAGTATMLAPMVFGVLA